MTASFKVAQWMQRRVWHRIPARRTTVLMVVAFLGLGSLYLQVRTDPQPGQTVLPIFGDLTTTTVP
jgi:hypothetical protein